MKNCHLFLSLLSTLGVSFCLLNLQAVSSETININICNNSGEKLELVLQQFGNILNGWGGSSSVGRVKGWYSIMYGECKTILFLDVSGGRGYRVYAQSSTRQFPSQSPPPTSPSAPDNKSRDSANFCINLNTAFGYGDGEAVRKVTTSDGQSCIAGFRVARFSIPFTSTNISINSSDMSPRKNNSSSLSPLPSGGVGTSCWTFVRPGFVFFNTHVWSDAPQTTWKYSMVINSLQGNTWRGIFGDGETVYGTVTDSDFTMRRDRWNQVWSGHCYHYGMSGTMRSTTGNQTGVFTFTK